MDNSTLIEILPYLAGATAFFLVSSLWVAGVVFVLQTRTRRKTLIRERLDADPGLAGAASGRVIELWRDGETVSTVVPGFTRKAGRLGAICQELGWGIPGAVLPLVAAAIFTAAFLLSVLVLGDLLLASAVGFGCIAVPYVYTNSKIAKRNALLEGQLVDALGLATRSLKAGHPLSGAFRVIAEEMEDPISSIFQNLSQQQDMGLSLEEALRNLSSDTTSEDLKMFTATVVIQMQSGGNLADTMGRLASVMRDRIRLVRKARALTAQTQMSKKVLIALPFIVALMIQILNADYLRPLLVTGIGRILLAIAAVLMLIGIWIMNMLSTLKY